MLLARPIRILVPLALAALAVVGWTRTQAYQPTKPSSEQQFLTKLAGTWDATITMTMGVGGQMVSKGTEVNTLVCGDKWMTTHFSAEMMGMPFEGHGMIGWDAAKKRYVGTWIDVFSESMVQMEGDVSDGKLVWEYDNKIMGMTHQLRDVMTIRGEDERQLLSSIVSDDGPVEQMRIEFTRRATGD